MDEQNVSNGTSRGCVDGEGNRTLHIDCGVEQMLTLIQSHSYLGENFLHKLQNIILRESMHQLLCL